MADARLRLISGPTGNDLSAPAWHIIPVMAIFVLYVVIGVSSRAGWCAPARRQLEQGRSRSCVV